VPVPPKGPQRALISTGSVHKKLEKVKFLEFLGATDSTVVETWLENMAM
jgi:hypothetical protein